MRLFGTANLHLTFNCYDLNKTHICRLIIVSQYESYDATKVEYMFNRFVVANKSLDKFSSIKE